MAQDLYVYLTNDNAVNLYDEIMAEFRARLASMVDRENIAARGITHSPDKTQDGKCKLSQIAQVIVNEELDDVSLVPYCPNVLYVRFAFADSTIDVKKRLTSLPEVNCAGSEKGTVGKQKFRERSAIRPEDTPCLGKKVCAGDCKACV